MRKEGFPAFRESGRSRSAPTIRLPYTALTGPTRNIDALGCTSYLTVDDATAEFGFPGHVAFYDDLAKTTNHAHKSKVSSRSTNHRGSG